MSIKDCPNGASLSLTKTKHQKINSMYSQINNIIHSCQLTANSIKIQRQKQYLKVFTSVMKQINQQVDEVNQRNKSLNKDRLKQSKCDQLETDIALNREQCYLLRVEVANKKQKLRQARIQEDYLIREQQALLVAIDREQRTQRIMSQKIKFLENGIMPISQTMSVDCQAPRILSSQGFRQSQQKVVSTRKRPKTHYQSRKPVHQ